MNAPDPETLKKVRHWAAYGDDDLRLARHGLAMGDLAPFHLIAYHAQQSVEKYLKAYLVLFGVDFPYTRNLLRLLELCPEKEPWAESLHGLQKLVPYAVSTRYPGIDEDVTEQEAREAVEIAVEVTQIIHGVLSEKGVSFNEKNGNDK